MVTVRTLIKGQWRDNDLMISDVSDKLRFRQRLCPRSFRGVLPNSHSQGQLKHGDQILTQIFVQSNFKIIIIDEFQNFPNSFFDFQHFFQNFREHFDFWNF